MIVVDTNIIGYLFLESPTSAMVERALEIDSEWAAPVLWRSEFCNVLALYMRKDLLTLTSSLQTIDSAIEVLAGNEYEVAVYQVLSLAMQSGCSAYDCEFVALAQDLNVLLLTTDKKILATFPDVSISLDEFCK